MTSDYENKTSLLYLQDLKRNLYLLSKTSKFKVMHIGTLILDDICNDIKELSEEIGIKFIVVDSYCSARKFYLNNQFTQINLHNPKKAKRKTERDKNKTILLYKDIEKI